MSPAPRPARDRFAGLTDCVDASIRLDGDVWSPAASRRFCAEQLRQWGCPTDLEGRAKLVVSELVTNVVLHAQTDATVALHLDDGVLRIEVSDAADQAVQPGRDRSGETRPGGWGLPLVESVARTWGVDLTAPDEPGKVVWAELDVGPASEQ